MISSLKRYLHIFKIALVVCSVFGFVVAIFLNAISNNKQFLSFQDNTQSSRQSYYETIKKYESDPRPDTKIALAVYKGISCALIGEACNNTTAQDKPKKGLITFMADNMFLPITNPPASGIGWIKNGLTNAGFVPKTEAAFGIQGIGFTAMKPFINLWVVFRDLAYMLLVLILIAIGFMIMFRMKLNPQTVISIENALPRIVITLVLITFSFAIAGLLIDIMYVSIAILITIMSNGDKFYTAADMHNRYLNSGGLSITLSMFPAPDFWSGTAFLPNMGNAMLKLLGPVEHIVRFVSGVFSGVYMFKNTDVIWGFIIKMFNGIAGLGFTVGELPSFVTSTLFHILNAAVGFGFGTFFLPQLLIGVLLLITIMFLTFRIFFMLLRSYIQILLLVIFAPLILLFEAVPGKNAFGFWFKLLLVELLTFPITVAVFLLGYIIVNTLAKPPAEIWSPPMTTGVDPSAFSILVGMTLIFTLPDLVKASKAFLGVKEGLPIGLNMGTFFGGATTAVGGGMGLIGGYGSLALAMPGLRGFAKKIAGGAGLGALFEEPKHS